MNKINIKNGTKITKTQKDKNKPTQLNKISKKKFTLFRFFTALPIVILRIPLLQGK